MSYEINQSEHFSIAPPKPLESSKNSRIKGSEILWSILTQKKILEKVVKLWSKKMSKKLKVTITFIDNVACKYLDTEICIEENLKEKT